MYLVIDYYLFNTNYSPLVISAILCSCIGILLSMIPKQCLEVEDAIKMKQIFGLINKDSNTYTSGMNTSGITTRTHSAFEEIHAQRRIRSARLYNNDTLM